MRETSVADDISDIVVAFVESDTLDVSVKLVVVDMLDAEEVDTLDAIEDVVLSLAEPETSSLRSANVGLKNMVVMYYEYGQSGPESRRCHLHS